MCGALNSFPQFMFIMVLYYFPLKHILVYLEVYELLTDEQLW